VHDLEVVDVHADGDDLAVGVDASEHAGVRVVDGMIMYGNVWSESYAIDRFFNAGDQRLAVRVELHVSSRKVAVDNLAVDEAALQISSNQIDAAHAASLTRGVGEERARRGVAKGRRPSLVKVDSRLQRVGLREAQRFLGRRQQRPATWGPTRACWAAF